MPFLGLYTKREVEVALKAVQVTARHLLAGAGTEKWEMPDPSIFRNQAELFRRLPDIGIAVEMLMNVGSMLAFQVMQRLSNEEEMEIPNHPLELLLTTPNPTQSGMEFMQDTLGFFSLNRNAYWWYNKTGPDAIPNEIWIIPPDKIVPVPNEKLYLLGYLYDTGNGQKISMETWEVEHFKGFNPFNRFVGLSLIEALAVSAMGSIEARKWNTKLFGENNARLPGILAFKDQINETDWIKLQEDAKDNAAKRQMMMLRGVGQGGVEWMQASATHREMEFLEGLQDTKRLIWDFIAPGLSSMLDPSATEASSKTGETVFRNYAVYPKMKYIESRLNRRDRLGENIGLVQSYGDNLFIRAEDIRITDRVLELQEHEKYSLVHTIDEIRREKYGDLAIGDARGRLLPAEVQAARVPFENESDGKGKIMRGETQAGAKKAIQTDYVPDLIKWREKALKRGAGKVVDYESELIPIDVHGDIVAALPATKSKTDIRLLFQKYIVHRQDDNVILITLLEHALDKYER